MYMRQAGQHTLGLDRLAHFQFHVIKLFSLETDYISRARLVSRADSRQKFFSRPQKKI